MSSNLRVNNILPSVGNNVAIGTAGGSVTLTGNVTGDITSSGVSTFTTLSATNIVGVSTLGVTTAYINTLSGISTIDAFAAVSINQNLAFASGKGIDFSADSNAAGMTSELLDDYEEGTWTPLFGGYASITYTNQAGSYVKIGNFVWIQGTISWSARTTSSNVYIHGLPASRYQGSIVGEGTYLYVNASNGSGNTQARAFSNTNNYYPTTAGSTGASTDPYGASGTIVFSGCFRTN